MPGMDCWKPIRLGVCLAVMIAMLEVELCARLVGGRSPRCSPRASTGD
jgi:hypothetical protein